MTLPTDRRDWPQWALDHWEERAAIIEYCGGRPREEAEREAESVVRLQVKGAHIRG